MAEKAIETLFSWTAEHGTDSVEWCPVNPYRNILACGSYHLQNPGESSSSDCPTEGIMSSRVGHIYLFEHREKDQFNLVYSTPTPGILDMKWCHQTVGGNVLLATANSEGQVQVYKLQMGSNVILKEIAHYDIGKVIALSLDWNNNAVQSQLAPRLVVSNDKGMVTILEISDCGLLKVKTWKAHDYEAWIAVFDCSNTCIVYTGGDDSVMRGFDSRSASQLPLFTSSEHTMGVTSLSSNHINSVLLASGSFDEKLAVWDTRKMTRTIAAAKTGGGVWRLKWNPKTGSRLVAACMQNNFQIFELSAANEILTKCASYKEHNSLAYGVDWKYGDEQFGFPASSGCDKNIVASCSFYDCKLNVWTWQE